MVKVIYSVFGVLIVAIGVYLLPQYLNCASLYDWMKKCSNRNVYSVMSLFSEAV